MTSKRRWHLLAGILLAALLGVMLATVLDYGMTADEPVQNRYGRRLVRWYTSLGADRAAVEQHDTFLYGGFFELAAQAARWVSPLGVYETRHVVNVLFGFGGFVAVLLLGERLGGPLAGILSVLFLALTPAYYGHAFNNPKDIPFAALYALGTAVIVRASDRLPRLRAREVLLVGVVVGLAAGVRVAGLVLVPLAGALWLGLLWLRGGRRLRASDLVRPGLALAGVLVLAWGVMVLFWPWAQLDPARNPFRAFAVFTRFWTSMPVLFDGQIVPSGQLPRTYIPSLFALTLPEFYLVAFLLGGLRLLGSGREQPREPKRAERLLALTWLGATVVGPVLAVVLNHTPLYNGHRHLLFVVPGLAALAGVSAAAGLRGGIRRPVRVAGAVVLGLSLLVTLVDMVRLHPYQAMYFNRLVAGGLARASQRYETDYWCTTYREGLDWIVDHYSRPDVTERIRVAGHATLTQVSYDLRRTKERRRRFRPTTIHGDPHLVLATTSGGDHRRTPGRVVHVVERLGAPLLYVFEVKKPH
ncbi:MAG: glycosyltransferase family 39 protein [Acidobacteria bacterium]|nr:glycosyltransferase family 39 protein [Acidobacteriota bacterium]